MSDTSNSEFRIHDRAKVSPSTGNARRPLVWLRVFIVIATAAAVAITIFLGERTFRETRRLATEQFNQQQLILAQSAARGIESYFKELAVGLQSLTRMPQFQQMDPKCLQCMEHTYWGFPTRTSLRLLDKDGVLRFIYPNHDWRKELIGRNYSKDTFFRETAKNGHTGVHVITNERGETRIRVAVAIYSAPKTETIEGTGVTTTQPSPIKPDPDRFCGVLVGSIDPCTIDRNLIRPIVSGRTGYAWLLDDRGVFLSHCEKDKEGQIEKLIAYAPVRVDSKVWSVAVCAPVSEVEEVIRASKRFELYTLGFIILVLITGGFSCYLLSYRWSRSLERQVRNRTNELNETSDYLTKLIRYANAPIIVWDPDRKITIFNKAFEKMSGSREAEVIGHPLEVLFPCESSGASLSKIEISKEQHWENVEIPILHKDGQVRVGLWNSANIYSDDGKTLVATVAQGQDITERKQTEEALQVSQQKFTTMAENIPGILFRAIVHKDGSITLPYVSPSARKFGLYGAEEMSVQPELLQVVIHPDYHEQFKEMTAAASGKLEPIDWEVRLNTRFTSIEFIRVIARPRATADGDVVWDGLALDIAARKQAEEALVQNERRFRLIMENTSDGINIVEYNPKTYTRQLIMCNDCYVEMSGRSREELMATDDLDRFTTEIECHTRPFHEQTLKGLPSMGLSHWNRPDGKENYYEWIATPQKVGDKYHIIGIDRDITERKRVEEALRESEEQYRAIFESATDALFIFDFDGTIVEANPAACATYGYSHEEMIGLSSKDIVHPEYYHQFDNFKQQVKATGQFFAESVDVRKDGSAFDVEIRGTAFTFKGKDHLMALVRDITERKQVTEALEKEKRQVEEYLNIAEVMLAVLDTDEKIALINKKGCEILSYNREELIGRNWFDLLVPERIRKNVRGVFCKLMAGDLKLVEYYENPLLTKHGEERIVSFHNTILRDADGQITGTLFSAEDITDRKQAEQEKAELEEQLRQAVKMEVIGRLAGGIAHDFNNMLAIIQGYADLLLKAMDTDDRNRDDVESIRTAASRAAALTRQLLAFGRRQAIRPKVLDLNEIIADTDSMLQRIIGEDIELITKPGKDLWYVKVDPRQIEEQVILNLAVNAREAMPDGGKITIKTANIVFDEDYACRHVEVDPGEYVMLAVSDTGTGMSEEIMSHIFEPFFSTKEAAKGSGLGLSTIYGIIKQSGGHIQVSSTPGKGSTFKIYLPRAAEPAEPAAGDHRTRRLPKGTETVLVTEDEPAVRDLTCRILREQGYTVLEAGSGAEAMRATDKHAEGGIHLLITDVIMPHMSGKELADQIRDTHPNTKVLFVSGYTGDGIARHGVLDKGVNFLAKPFTSRQLIRTVRRTLDANA